MGTKIYRISITLLLVLPLVSMVTHAEVYRWVDEEGTVHFGDKPISHPSAEKIEINKDAVQKNKRQRSRLNKQKHLLSVLEEERKINKKKKAEEMELKKERMNNCKRSMKAFKDYMGSGQLSSIDKEGNKIYLSDQEREQEIQKAREAVEYWCK